jgi:mucolipin
VLVIKLWAEGCVLFVGCLNLTVEPNVTAGSYSSKEFVKGHGIVIDFSALVRASVMLSLKTVNFKAAGPITPPDCYRFDVVVRNWPSLYIST